jgi:cyclohexyl-isocyanide hydratase
MSAPLQIGLVIFPKVTQLDFTGPLQVFSSLPGAKVHLIWKRIEPVTSDSVLTLTPTTTFADCPQLDVICVPGGAGSDDMVNDEEMLDFLRRQAAGAKYITSVCTGALVLGAAGLLRGYRATTHWTAMEFLEKFGGDPYQDAGLRRPQPHHRRRRHRRHRFRADAGLDPGRSPDRRSDPASAGI